MEEKRVLDKSVWSSTNRISLSYISERSEILGAGIIYSSGVAVGYGGAPQQPDNQVISAEFDLQRCLWVSRVRCAGEYA